MTAEEARNFGDYLRARREIVGLSKLQLAQLTQTRDSTISRLEAGAISAPRPDKLTRIAGQLDLDLADVFAMVGYVIPRQLPTALPYLRAKYPDLPQEAIEEIGSHLRSVAQRHGVKIDYQEVTHDPAAAKADRPTPKSLEDTLGRNFK